MVFSQAAIDLLTWLRAHPCYKLHVIESPTGPRMACFYAEDGSDLCISADTGSLEIGVSHSKPHRPLPDWGALVGVQDEPPAAVGRPGRPIAFYPPDHESPIHTAPYVQ